jgi:predicted permease
MKRRQRMLDNLDQDIRDHIEMETQDNIARGLSAEEARYAALRKFGNVMRVKEETHEVWSLCWFEQLLQDIRFGLRMLRNSPGFTVVAVLTLALGIGANTAIFTLINAALLRDLPVRDPEQLVLLNWTSKDFPKAIQSLSGTIDERNSRTTSTSFSYPVFEKFATQKDLFSQVFAFASVEPASVRLNGNSSIAEADVVTGGFFSGLGVTPILGRTISDADEEPGAPPVTVISSSYWRSAFGGDPSVVGKSVTVNSVAFTVVGVAGPEFFGVQPGRAVDLWLPASSAPQLLEGWASLTARENWWLVVMARLKPGVSETQARATLDVLLAQEATAGIAGPPRPEDIPHSEFSAASRGLNDLRQQFSKPLEVLMIVVALVLLIACANVANLLLARAAGRSREITIRLAVGAGRFRLVRQLLTESLLLAAAGAALGSLLALWGTRILVVLITNPSRPIEIALSLDSGVLLFTVLLSAATAIVFGLAPALHATRVALQSRLKENASSTAGQVRAKFRLRKTLVVAQTAISVVLLVGAGLFVRTLVKLKNQDLGFNAANILTFRLEPQLHGYAGPRILAFYEDILDRIKVLPGVESAGLSSHRLMADSANIMIDVSAEGVPPETTKKVPVWLNAVSPDFLRTMQIKTVLGRGIGPQDAPDSLRVALVNQAFTRRFWGELNPIGRWISLEGQPGKAPPRITVVGVTTDAKYSDIHEPPPPTVYVSFQQNSRSLHGMDFEVRTSGEAAALVSALRQIVGDVDKDIPLENVLTQTEQIDASLLQERMFAKLVSFFGGLALLLACIGLYGVMVYTVMQRTHEIGIRKALGAQAGSVLRMILRESLLLIAIGAALGVLAAYFSMRLIASFLFQLKPNDPVALLSAVSVLAVVAFIAALLPARRAMRVDPMVALRYE